MRHEYVLDELLSKCPPIRPTWRMRLYNLLIDVVSREDHNRPLMQ